MRPHPIGIAPAAIAPLLLAIQLAAQDTRPVIVRVTATAAPRSVWLDAGRDAGLRPGTEIELTPAAAATVRVRVREVTASRARAELIGGGDLPPVGTPGEAQVDAPETSPSATPKRADGVPSHAPWALDETGFDQQQPLLAPMTGMGPADRPMRFTGRIFGQTTYNRDDGDGRGNESLLARLGTRFRIDNPAGLGGRLRFEGELTHRAADLADLGSDASDRGRLDWVSYAHGDDERAPWRIEAGRFVSTYVPELGLVDGVEATRRLNRSWSVGVGAGALPLPFPARRTGEDLGMHAFAQWRDTDPERSSASATLGVQKTWHRGAPDRDLLFGRGDWSPVDSLRFDASFKVDYYTGKDTLKDDVELTEAWLGAHWRPTDVLGLGLTASTYRWAQLLRGELFFVAPELVRDGHVERLSPRIDVRMTDDLRLRGRVDWWQDQNDSGTGGELALDWSGPFGPGSSASIAAFRSAGSFQQGPGLRARAAFRAGVHTLSARYQGARWETVGQLAGATDYLQHRLGVTADLAVADAVALQIDAEYVFGDEQNGIFVGTWIQYRW